MIDYATDFLSRYNKLKEKERNNFSKLVNKLLSVNYLTNQKESDLEDYYFISGHFDLFKSYFYLMEFDLTYYPDNRVIALSNKENYNRLNLKLNESIVLLIIRLLYDEKMREVSLIDKIIINLENIHDKFLTTGLKDRRLSKTELKQILLLFKRFNLLDIIDSDFSDDESRIVLYSSILYAVNIENITEVYNKLSTYKKDGDNNEEISED